MDGNAYCHCAVYSTTHIHCRADSHGSVLPFVRCRCRRASSRVSPAWAGEHRSDTGWRARPHRDVTDRRFQRFTDDRRVAHRRAQERRARERSANEASVKNRRNRGKDRRRGAGW